MLTVILEADNAAMTAPEVARVIGISKAGAWRRLRDIGDQGLLEPRVEEGATLKTWSLTDAGRTVLED